MNSILRRRRALIGQKDQYILWQVNNLSVSGGRIISDVALCNADRNFTIAYDVTIQTSPSSGYGSTPRFVTLLSEDASNFAIGLFKRTANANNYTFSYMGQNVDVSYTGTGRLRFVITHSKNSDSASIAIKKDNGAVDTVSISQSFSPTSRFFTLGASETSDSQLPQCILNVTVFSKVFSTNEINAFLQ